MEMTKSDYAARLARLRTELVSEGLAGMIVPRANAHLGEYVPPSDERLAWISGFTGSAGSAVILADRAAVFTDGRYQIQLAQQTDAAWFEQHHSILMPPSQWLREHVQRGQKIGFDPWHHSITQAQALVAAAQEAGAETLALSENLIDRIWTDRAPAPAHKLIKHDIAYAGQRATEKIAAIADAMQSEAAFLTDPTSTAWLLNIRGRDIPHTPIALCFAIIYKNASVDLFLDAARIPSDVAAHLGDPVRIQPPEKLGEILGQIKTIQLDKNATPYWVFARAEKSGAEIVFAPDPCLMPKAIKNTTELDGMRNAHIRDGTALSQFLCWLSQQQPPPDEMSVVKKLEHFRSRQNMFCDTSFDTIAGSGPHGAIVHYRVDDASNRQLQDGELFLLDSGGQYLDGTTDVTRTIAIGTPQSEMKHHFTLVLKGHIALASAIFPRGTSGHQLDALARRPLWEAGLDFDHGTGHGVGAFLSVHEGPQAISPRGTDVALHEGMIISNEPGFYKKNAYGIRIENLVAVVRRHDLDNALDGTNREMLGFETITCAPIDLDLIAPELLNEQERSWLNDYHRWVGETLSPRLPAAEKEWLITATRAI